MSGLGVDRPYEPNHVGHVARSKTDQADLLDVVQEKAAGLDDPQQVLRAAALQERPTGRLDGVERQGLSAIREPSQDLPWPD